MLNFRDIANIWNSKSYYKCKDCKYFAQHPLYPAGICHIYQCKVEENMKACSKSRTY